ILLGVFVLLFGVWLGISAYNKYWKNSGVNLPAVNPPATGQLPSNNSKDEEAKIKSLAENFVFRYYSYVWGSFSGVESQYDNMSDELRNQEEAKIREIKAIMSGQPRKFFTVQADVIDSKIDEYNINEKAILTVKMSVKEINGALVTSEEVPEIKPNTSGWVNGDGKAYRGSIDGLIAKKIVKSINIVLVKEGNGWKIDEFNKSE
ncbi:hypothetical protein KKA96_01665, partial [Patescibacteria group bacterium]|nr:hypothetical protein [Patescibacteria group bacterium]